MKKRKVERLLSRLNRAIVVLVLVGGLILTTKSQRVEYKGDPTLYAGVMKELSTLNSSVELKEPLSETPEESISIEEVETPSVAEGNDEEVSEELEEEVSCPNRWGITLTDDEYTLFAKLVYRESGNQCIEGQEAVAEVILNRVYSDRYPDTLYEVLSQPHQFEAWKVRNKGTVSDRTYQACDNVLQGKTNHTSFDYIAFSRGGHSKHRGSFRIQDHQFCTK